MSLLAVILLLMIPALLAVWAGITLLRRALSQNRILPEEVALAFAWVFLVGGLFWLGVYLSESSFLGFSAPWSWLAAAHFTFAGFGALSVTALCCRVVSDLRARFTLRLLLFIHPIAYLVTAAGIYGVPFCEQIGAIFYSLLFYLQFTVVLLGSPDRIARRARWLLLLSLSVPLFTIIPAIAWAFGIPILELADMVKYHGIVNAIGHVALGLAALGWGRAPSHSTISEH